MMTTSIGEKLVLFLALMSASALLGRDSLAQNVEESENERYLRVEYRQSLDMPDGIALRMLFAYLEPLPAEEAELFAGHVSRITGLNTGEAKSLTSYLRSLREEMREELTNEIFDVACENDVARSSGHRAAITLDLIDDLRVSTYSKYLTIASAHLHDESLTGLQKWLANIKISSNYTQRDHEARYLSSKPSAALSSLDSYCAQGRR